MANVFSITATAEPEVSTSGTKTLTAVFALMALIGIGAGLYGFYAGHHAIYNNTREVPWGILISSYAFFAIISTGLCLLAAISHVFGGNKMAPLANRMVWLSLITIIAGFAIIGLELESPWRMAIYNVISPNPTSNIWWMGTLYGLAVGMMLVEFYLILTKQFKLAIALGVMGALAEVAANTNLGAVFATLSGRPFWYGSQLPIFFLGNAFLCGAAAAIMFTHYAYVIRRRSMDADTLEGVRSAGKVLMLMLVLITVATAWRMISYFVGGMEGGRLAAEAMMSGPLANSFWVFEITIGLAIPLLLLVVTRLNSVAAMSAAALMTIVGLFFRTYNTVVAGQIIPVYPDTFNAPATLSYTPSLAEILLVMAGVGIVGTAFLLGERFFGKAYALNGDH
ncbi:MAG: NrfD/PsrC family molybdoenzyme membrane anchor subunit [Desulfobulbaceae bacterium]|nr:polysulfide reductase NrfD [Desulfobulbaceae bacterium]MDY0351289.1 NrfD/PsrC family molybdoenzyme membrane anchor subunit [Desulfobulbaceae bacterium]